MGYEGRGDGQFEVPISVSIDSKGNIIVKDAETARLQKFDSEGNFLMKFTLDGEPVEHSTSILQAISVLFKR